MSGSEPLVAREVAFAQLLDLRRRVLRDGDATAAVSEPRDLEPAALHLGVFAGERLVASGSFYPAPAPAGAPGGRASYQLRYMATEPPERGRGAGSLLLRAAESRLSSRGVGLLWANARDSALGFYERCGFEVVAGSQHLSAETALAHSVVTRVLAREEPYVLDWAGPGDAAALAALREEMYFALYLREHDPSWVEEATRFFATGLADASVIAVVARTAAGEVVGVACASRRAVAPMPHFPRGDAAYLFSVSTAPGFRRRGVARAVVSRLVDELTRLGVERVELHASNQGEEVYRDLGFEERHGSLEMRLVLVDPPTE
jgi:GNAT superfamily N-acetyltransferase